MPEINLTRTFHDNKTYELFLNVDYYIECKKSDFVAYKDIFRMAEADTLPVMRKTKSSEREYDLKTGIHELWVPKDGAWVCCYRDHDGVVMNEEQLQKGLMHCEQNEDRVRFIVVCDAGSDKNVSTELVSEVLHGVASVAYEALHFRTHRMELFGKNAEGQLIPLCKTN